MANRIFTSKGVQGVSSAEEAAEALEREAKAILEEASRRVSEAEEEANRRILAILDAFWSGSPEDLAKAMGADPEGPLFRAYAPDRPAKLEEAMNGVMGAIYERSRREQERVAEECDAQLREIMPRIAELRAIAASGLA